MPAIEPPNAKDLMAWMGLIVHSGVRGHGPLLRTIKVGAGHARDRTTQREGSDGLDEPGCAFECSRAWPAPTVAILRSKRGNLLRALPVQPLLDSRRCIARLPVGLPPVLTHGHSILYPTKSLYTLTPG
jgi:hypothetical protein